MSKLLFSGTEPWTEELLQKMWDVIRKIAVEKYDLTFFEPQIEIVSANQMMHYSSMVGLPFTYNHWSFGKSYTQTHDAFHAGQTGIAYETIINSDPAVCYVCENNSATLQALVLAHAAVGHSSFFRNNEAFKQFTQPDAILDYARYAKKYVADCEEKHGALEVEYALDAIHSLQYHGIDRFLRTRQYRDDALERMKAERARYEDIMQDEMWKTLPQKSRDRKQLDKALDTLRYQSKFPWPFPEENLLYFIEKNSPSAPEWKRELMRIVRTFAQYFYPQMQTKVMNEGWASFWHYTLMVDLYEEGYIDAGSYIEFIKNHTAVCNQRLNTIRVHTKLNENINPYALGFRMFSKLRQACENPTEQDKKELKAIAGQPWLATLKTIANDYVDSTFLGQFMTSDVAQEFGFLAAQMEEKTAANRSATYSYVNVNTIQDSATLSDLREALRTRYSIGNLVPRLEVVDFRIEGDRSLVLQHLPTQGMALQSEDMRLCMKNIQALWGKYPIELHTIDEAGKPFVSKRSY